MTRPSPRRGSTRSAWHASTEESWAHDRQRRRAARVPDDVPFRTKGQIALEQIAALRREDVPPAPVVADAGYGVVTAWRDQLTLQEIPYMVGVTGENTVWPPGQAPLPPPTSSRTGRPPPRVRRN